jgi:hypothetical protein
MKKAVFWELTSYGSCENRHFRGKYRLHHQGEIIRELGTFPGATSGHISDEGILHCRRRETSNLTILGFL